MGVRFSWPRQVLLTDNRKAKSKLDQMPFSQNKKGHGLGWWSLVETFWQRDPYRHKEKKQMELIFDLKTGPVMLRSSEMCYEICRLRYRTDKNTGVNSDSWEPYLYPVTLEKGLSRIMDMKIKASDARTLAELKAAVESARDEVSRVWGACQ